MFIMTKIVDGKEVSSVRLTRPEMKTLRSAGRLLAVLRKNLGNEEADKFVKQAIEEFSREEAEKNRGEAFAAGVDVTPPDPKGKK